MKGALLVMCITVLLSMALLLVIFGQQMSEANVLQHTENMGVLFREKNDDLQERMFLSDILEMQLRDKNATLGDLDVEVARLQPEREKKRVEAEACEVDKRKKQEELAAAQKEQSDREAFFKTEKEAWTTDMTTLQQQVAQKSKICEFVKRDSAEGCKLCGLELEIPKPVEPKVEEPKPQQPKPEEPKAEPPKPEEPKAKEPTAEQPKPEEPKAKEPKAESPKPEEPKAKEPKAEQPKPEEPKQAP